MSIASLIRENPDAIDSKIAAIFNSLPSRYAPLRLTFLEMGDALVEKLRIDPNEAVALANRLIADVTETSAQNNDIALASIFQDFARQGASIDFSRPLIRSQLARLTQSPFVFTVEDLQTVASLLTDLHGGETTEQQVAAVRAEVALEDATARTDSYRSSADSAVAGLSAAERGSWAAVRDAWVAAGDAAAAAGEGS